MKYKSTIANLSVLGLLYGGTMPTANSQEIAKVGAKTESIQIQSIAGIHKVCELLSNDRPGAWRDATDQLPYSATSSFIDVYRIGCPREIPIWFMKETKIKVQFTDPRFGTEAQSLKEGEVIAIRGAEATLRYGSGYGAPPEKSNRSLSTPKDLVWLIGEFYDRTSPLQNTRDFHVETSLTSLWNYHRFHVSALAFREAIEKEMACRPFKLETFPLDYLDIIVKTSDRPDFSPAGVSKL